MVDFYLKAVGFRHKLLAMGLTPGVVLKIICIAPLGDPIQVSLRGFTLSLRKKECQQIEVEYIHAQPPECDDKISNTTISDCTCRQS